jgi:hypothetical protein
MGGSYGTNGKGEAFSDKGSGSEISEGSKKEEDGYS